MKDWIKRIFGGEEIPDPAPNTDLSATDDYVVVKKKDLDDLIAELQNLRNQKVDTDARELDMMVAELEHENKLLRARNERLEAEAKLQ